MLGQNPSVIVKRKNIQAVIDYCLDNKIECRMVPRDMPEEWEMEFQVADIMKAINLGMFLKENKLDLTGLMTAAVKTSSAPAAVKAPRNKKEKTEAKKDMTESVLDTGGIFNTTKVNTENIFNTAPASAAIDADDELPL